ncbi:hypothetical protein Tco_0502068, partial [Tanacetum coccineum]
MSHEANWKSRGHFMEIDGVKPNEAVNTAHEVTTASSQGKASSSTNADDVMFFFFANQSNSPQLDNEDLEQIDTDDLKEMDLKWAPRNQGNRNRDALRRNAPVDTSTTNALVHQVHQVQTLSVKDKAGLGYDSQMKDSEVVHSVFNSKESDVDDSPVNDRFKTGKEFHAVPPPYTWNYMPSRPDLSFARLDNSVYKTKMSETETSIIKTSKDIVEKPKTVRPSAPIIEDWDIDSDNDSMFRPKSGQVPVNVVKQSSPRAAASISIARTVNIVAPKSKVNDALPKTYSYFKAHSPVKRAFNKKYAAKTNNLNEKVKTAKVNNVTTAGPKAVVSVAKGNRKNAGNPQYTLQGQNIFDSGCSRHMTGNKSFLTDYQEIDGGFVAFGGSPKEGKMTGKGKIRTGKLDFKDVYFVKELKFNIFSVSQMCDKKNSVLFT